MQRFENILFLYDAGADTTTAFERAVRLASANGARLTLAAVGKKLPRRMPELQKAFNQASQEQLQALADSVKGKGLKVRTSMLIGIPFIEVIRSVVRRKYDLVIKTAEGRGGVSNVLFGSTDQHLFRKCPCPVWVIKPSKRKHYARIMAAVDPDPEDAENASLSDLIIELSASLARRENSELHIVHAWSLTYEHELRSPRFNVPKSEVDRAVRDTRRLHKEWMDQLLAHHDLQELQVNLHLLKGEPGDIIPAAVKKKRVELVVMGTVARSGIAGFLIGNTAEKALSSVDCSVLAVKPENFVTPVEL